MKTGIISDIHANLPALESIIKYFKKNNVERIIHLGDAIGMGPFPCETLDYMKTLDNCKMILGNHENYFITKIPENISMDEINHDIWVMQSAILRTLRMCRFFKLINLKNISKI